MFQEAEWKLEQADQKLVDKLAAELELSQLTAEILVRRGFSESAEVKQFLQFDSKDMHDPHLLADIEPAVDRIQKAVGSQEKIMVYGDYDVDGITSTALVVDYIQSLGGNVEYYIPNRLEEGYGLNQEAVKELADSGTELMITVDCGIKAQAEIKRAQELGIDVIITDHHTPPAERVPALAVIDPHQERCDYPWKKLCGAGVAFKLTQALAEKSERETTEPPLVSYLGLVALATIADIVALQGENRIIVSSGLEQLNQLELNQQPGLAALAKVAGFADKQIRAGNVGYQLAPRLNAAGRLGEPETGVELLLADDYFTAQEVANRLNRLNNQRKEISDRIFAEAEEAVRGFDLEEEWVIVLASPHWHSGVIGNVASDLQEKYHRPVVLIALDGGGEGPGSCRSISSFNIYQALQACSDLLIGFGGHRQAAGFSITAEQVPKLRSRLNQLAKEKLEKEDLRPQQRVDGDAELADLSFSLLEELEALAPFGYRNPRPVLKAASVEVDSFRLVGSNQQHLKLSVSQDGCRLDGIGFGQAEYKQKLQLQQEDVNLLFQLDRNEWQGQVNLQLRIKDLQVSSPGFWQRLFNSAGREEAETSDYDWFYLPLPRSDYNLEVGQKLELEHRRGRVLLTTGEQAVAEINTQFSEQLKSYLDLGIEYQAVVAETGEEVVEVFISRKLNDLQVAKPDDAKLNTREVIAQVEEEILSGSLSAAERKLLTQLADEDKEAAVGPVFNRLPLVKTASCWQAVKKQQMTVIITPVKHLAVTYHHALQRDLNPQGIDCRLGTSSLSLSEEGNLKRALADGEVDVLVATPEFIARHQHLLFKPGLVISNQATKDRFAGEKLAPQRQLLFSNESTGEEEKLLMSDWLSKSVQLNDKRNSAAELDYLTSLLAERKKVLIYVTTAEASRKLAAKLSTSQKPVLFYNSNLDLADQRRVIDKFSTSQASGLVATTDLLLEGVGLTDIVVYQPGFSCYQFKEQLSQLAVAKAETLQLHLLYNEQEIEKSNQLITDKNPNRKLLKELYLLLSKLDKGQSKAKIKEEDLYQLWAQSNKRKLKEITLTTMLGILAELGLITRVKELERGIKLAPQPEIKLDLADSMRYNECVIEKKEFAVFVKSVLTASKQEILNLMPGERGN